MILQGDASKLLRVPSMLLREEELDHSGKGRPKGVLPVRSTWYHKTALMEPARETHTFSTAFGFTSGRESRRAPTLSWPCAAAMCSAVKPCCGTVKAREQRSALPATPEKKNSCTYITSVQADKFAPASKRTLTASRCPSRDATARAVSPSCAVKQGGK